MGNIKSIALCSPYLGVAVSRWLLMRVFEPLVANKGPGSPASPEAEAAEARYSQWSL